MSDARDHCETSSPQAVAEASRDPQQSRNASPTNDSIGGIPYELRIGITGHRRLDNPDQVRKAVDHLLREIATTFTSAVNAPHGPCGSPPSSGWKFDWALTRVLASATRRICPVVNAVLRRVGAPDRWCWPVVPVSGVAPGPRGGTPLKLTIISGLAIGTDQIAVESLQEMLEKDCPPGVVSARYRNRFVEAVLPFPVREYERDFDSAAERERFQRLLTLDRGRFEPFIEPTVVHPQFPSDGRGATLDRSAAYAAAGRYVVDSCELLIAIWDPEREEGVGGTAETARYAIDRQRTVLWLNPARLEAGTRRLTRSSPEATTQASAESDAPPDGLAAHHGFDPPSEGEEDAATQTSPLSVPHLVAKDLSRNFHHLAAYNRDTAVTAEELDSAIGRARESFVAAANRDLPPKVCEEVAERLLPRVVRADELSKRYRDLRNVAAWLWPTLAALIVTLMAFQILFLPSLYWLAWIEVTVLLVCGVSYRVSLHEAWHDKWRNDRRLAEGLRSAFYVCLVMPEAARSPSPVSTPDANSTGASSTGVANPLPFYDPSQSWLVAASKRIVRREWRRFAKAIDWSRDVSGMARFLANAWIEGQATYHEENDARHDRVATRHSRLRLGILAAIVVIAVLHALGVGHHESHGGEHLFSHFDLWIAWATVSLPAWGAAVHALATAEDHERLSDRSERMVPLLRSIAGRMRTATTREQLATLVREAETLLDLENQEWAESLSERVPEVGG